jgi:hypothetical protein
MQTLKMIVMSLFAGVLFLGADLLERFDRFKARLKS